VTELDVSVFDEVVDSMMAGHFYMSNSKGSSGQKIHSGHEGSLDAPLDLSRFATSTPKSSRVKTFFSLIIRNFDAAVKLLPKRWAKIS